MNQRPPEDHAAIAISFLIANWNGGEMLRECLDSIDAQQIHETVEVIVIDNGSTDASCELPHFERPHWQLRRLDTNIGFAAANNLAFGMSRGAFVALINNDIRLHADWSARMLDALRNHPEAASAACRIVQHADPHVLDSAGFSWHTCGAVTSWQGQPADRFANSAHRPFGPVASAALYRRSALKDTCLFREPFFAYYEDTDLAVRLRLFGHDCVYVDSAIATHHGSATGKRTSGFRDYHLRRNIEYLYWINMVQGAARRNLGAHCVYETAAFCHALWRGHIGDFLAAKWAFLRHIGWVIGQRRELAGTLRNANRISKAKDILATGVCPTWKLLLQRSTLRQPA